MATSAPDFHVEPSKATINVRSKWKVVGSSKPVSSLLCDSAGLNRNHSRTSLLTHIITVIDTTTWMSGLSIKGFVDTPIKGHEQFDAPSFAFLIEHPTGRKLVFDLGVRKDYHNMAPIWGRMQASMGESAKVEVKQGVREILEAHGVSGSDIEAVIWSHWHFDQ